MEISKVESSDLKSDEAAEYIPAILLLPSGALDNAYNEEDIRLDNICAKASVTILNPKDDPDNG